MTTPAQRHEYSCIDAWGVNWRQRATEKREAEAARQRELDAARALVLAVEQVVDAFTGLSARSQRSLPNELRQGLEVLADTLYRNVDQDNEPLNVAVRFGPQRMAAAFASVPNSTNDQLVYDAMESMRSGQAG